MFSFTLSLNGLSISKLFDGFGLYIYDRYWSKILRGTIPTPDRNHKVKVTDSIFMFKICIKV